MHFRVIEAPSDGIEHIRLTYAIVGEDDSKRFDLFVDIIDKGTKSCQTERDDKTMLIAMSTTNYGISNI